MSTVHYISPHFIISIIDDACSPYVDK